jgi:hypothetical protein
MFPRYSDMFRPLLCPYYLICTKLRKQKGFYVATFHNTVFSIYMQFVLHDKPAMEFFLI